MVTLNRKDMKGMKYFITLLTIQSIHCFVTTPIHGRKAIQENAISKTSLNLGDFFPFGKKEKETPPKKEDDKPEYDDAAYDESDPVEGIFSFFFGKREQNPMGMSRFGPDRFPEQYPATKTEAAPPLEADDAFVASTLRPLLKNTNLESRALQCVYDANRDGWDAVKFHARVDKRGPSVVVCQTQGGLTCGGYNPKGWVGYGEARGSIAAFLFTVPKGEKTSSPENKLIKVGGPALAQIDNPENGPSFGADALCIPFDGRNPRLARSKLGSYYERFPDGGNSLFGKEGSSVKLKDLKVYIGVYEEREYVPFTDAEPFALY